MTVLVAYASKHGSTAEIAQAIARELGDAGVEAECLEAHRVKSLEPGGAAVLDLQLGAGGGSGTRS